MSEEKPKKRRVGNPNMIKGGPPMNPKGRGAGVTETLNREIREALHHALEHAKEGGAKAYMVDLAQNKPALFVGMLQKVMPNEVAVTAAVSLGDAMAEANKRLEQFQQQMIDVTPEAKVNDINDLADGKDQAPNSVIDTE